MNGPRRIVTVGESFSTTRAFSADSVKSFTTPTNDMSAFRKLGLDGDLVQLDGNAATQRDGAAMLANATVVEMPKSASGSARAFAREPAQKGSAP